MPPNFDYLFICHLHFKSEDLIATPKGYQKCCIKENAVPFFSDPNQMADAKIIQKQRFCKIVDCENSKGVPFSRSIHMYT